MTTLKLGAASLMLMLTTITLGAASVNLPQSLSVNPQDADCLAKNIYHEARGESLQGQIAVAQVTLNRVKSGKFQRSICDVVYAHKQFSWTIGGRKKIKDTKAWEASVAIANAVLAKSVRLPDFKALYFHTKKVNPRWNKNRPVLAIIGNHVFYS